MNKTKILEEVDELMRVFNIEKSALDVMFAMKHLPLTGK